MTESSHDRVAAEQESPIQPRVRRLTREDMQAVVEIERLGYAFPWSDAVWDDCLRSGYTMLGIERGPRLEGYAVLATIVDEAHLLNLCIRPSSRGRGLARRLLHQILREAGHLAVARVILEVRVSNQGAQALYLSEGFEVVGGRRGYYPDAGGREDALVMALGISGPASPEF